MENNLRKTHEESEKLKSENERLELELARVKTDIRAYRDGRKMTILRKERDKLSHVSNTLLKC